MEGTHAISSLLRRAAEAPAATPAAATSATTNATVRGAEDTGGTWVPLIAWVAIAGLITFAVVVLCAAACTLRHRRISRTHTRAAQTYLQAKAAERAARDAAAAPAYLPDQSCIAAVTDAEAVSPVSPVWTSAALSPQMTSATLMTVQSLEMDPGVYMPPPRPPAAAAAAARNFPSAFSGGV